MTNWPAQEAPTGLADDVLALLFAILKEQPEGISEYDLLRALERQYQVPFAKAPFGSDFALFQAHFLLFNALYRLRDRLADANPSWQLEIHALCIALRPSDKSQSARALVAGAQALTPADPLRAYYLDINQLAATDCEQIAELLGDFWMRYFALESRAAALAVLGLADPVDRQEVRRRYRELAMRLHPDRGGTAEAFQRLQSARQLLERSAPRQLG
jgi:hypothetical protein